MGNQGPQEPLETHLGRAEPGRGRGSQSPRPPCWGCSLKTHAALPHSHSSTSSSSSTSCGFSPPSCGRPTLAGVIRGSSTGEPCPPCLDASDPRGHWSPEPHSKAGRGPRDEPVSRKGSAPDSLAGPPGRGGILLGFWGHPLSQPGPLGARPLH